MADQSGSTHFRVRFESALQAYQQMTGIKLAEHPLTLQIQNLHSVKSIIGILENEARASSGLLGSDRIMKSIESTVSMLFTLSAAASFDDAIGMVRKERLWRVSTSLTGFYSHTHLGMQYLPASLFYLLYVPFSSTYVYIVVTSK